MTALFLTICQMSLTASFAVLLVLLVRQVLKKAPTIFSYALWAVVLFRLVCPFSWESAFSFFPVAPPNMPQDIASIKHPGIHSVLTQGEQAINKNLAQVFPKETPKVSMPSWQILLDSLAILWLGGCLFLFGYGLFAYFRLKHRLATATLVQDNIFTSDRIQTAFVLGVLKPKIYLPLNLGHQERAYVLQHEQTHVKRFDHLLKPLAFMALAVHWFNPLIWLSYGLMTKDMEMSCDESVLRRAPEDIRGNYAKALLSFSQNQSLLSPLAFGEKSIKTRIRNVLQYRRPAFWLILVALIAVAAVTLGLCVNPLGKEKALVQTQDPVAQLLENKTPYVGNNSKVGALVGCVPLPLGVQLDSIALQTHAQPYGVTVQCTITDYQALAPEGKISNLAFCRNAIILLSVIDNADSITYMLTDKNADFSCPIVYTRQQAQEALGGQDIRQFAQDETQFRAFYQQVYNTLVLPETQWPVPPGAAAKLWAPLYQDLASLPQELPPETAVAQGCFVVVHGKLQSSLDLSEQFIANSQQGKKADLTVVIYTVEGDPIVTRVTYDGTVYRGVMDISRDAFAGESASDRQFTYPYLKTWIEQGTQYVYLLHDPLLTLADIQNNQQDKPVDCLLLYAMTLP